MKADAVIVGVVVAVVGVAIYRRALVLAPGNATIRTPMFKRLRVGLPPGAFWTGPVGGLTDALAGTASAVTVPTAPTLTFGWLDASGAEQTSVLTLT